MLRVQDVHTYYGHSHILQGTCLEVHKGEVVSLLGRNGVGKSTLLKSVMGLVPPRSGRIQLGGQDISGLPPYRIATRGVGFVPERRLFSQLSVLENLEVGLYVKGADKAQRAQGVERAFVRFPRLKERRKLNAGSLSGGEQQMLAIARALVTDPQLILLDEPLEGLMPLLVTEILDSIRQLSEEGTTVLLIEHNVRAALAISNRAYIMTKGVCHHEMPARDLLADTGLLKKYLGVG